MWSRLLMYMCPVFPSVVVHSLPLSLRVCVYVCVRACVIDNLSCNIQDLS